MSIISLALLSSLSCLILLTAQPDFLQDIPIHCYCDKANNYNDKSAYHFNLVTVLSSLKSDTKIDYGFYNMSYGQGPDRVRAVGLCRGDINSDNCRSCLNYTTEYLSKHCPNQKEAMVYNDYCMLRYSDKSIFGLYENPNHFFQFNNSQVVKQANFNKPVNDLLQNLTRKAAAGDSRLKLAASNVEILLKETTSLYGLVQCTPDLSEEDCKNCLQKAILEINHCCWNINGARVVKMSCNIRYEVYPFYNSTSINSIQPSTTASNTRFSQEGHSARSKAVLIKIIVPVIIIILITLYLVGCFLRRKERKISTKAILRKTFGEESSKLKTLQFSYAAIESATNKFSEENKIGKGGFGEVYKGVLFNGQEIAVKRLSRSSAQGILEFKNEILLIAKLQHRNLVTLLGFCLEGQEKILIYEFVLNKSVDFFLFDTKKQRLLNWSERFKIIGGIAQGLSYLHEHSCLKVIHRDLKPSNILLDNKMNPKISDFGTAKMINIDEDKGSTNRIVGTYGYMAPEYLMFGQFSEKSDIFSFGVIILEILSGRRNAKSYESYLLSNVWKQWNEGTPLQVLDPFIMESCSQTEVMKCMQIGLLCVQRYADDRPTITQIVSYLNNLSIELPPPREPAFFIHSNPTVSPESGLDRTPHQSFNIATSNGMSISELLPR